MFILSSSIYYSNNIDAQILELRTELNNLREDYKKIDSENKFLHMKNAELSKENLALIKELNNLKDKLNINSSNSGLPTSKEIYKREKSSRTKSERNPGGQPGHKSSFYQFKTPDEIVDILPEEKQCICGGDLEIEEGFESYQKIEISPIKPFETEYRKKWTPKIGQ